MPSGGVHTIKASLGATLLHGLGNVHPFAQGHALIAFREIYNTTWLIERHGIRAE
jgi:hypothetical protein